MSILSSFLGGGGNASAAEQKKLSKLAEREQFLGDSLLQNWQDVSRQGAFDPNAQLDALKADTAYQTGINTKNAAGASRILGYRPGDSVPIQQQNEINNKSALQYADLSNQIRNNAFQSRLSSYGQAALGAGSLYGQGANIYGNVAGLKNQAAQQQSPFASLLGAVTPFMTAGATGGSSLLSGFGKSPGGGSGFSLPFTNSQILAGPETYGGANPYASYPGIFKS